MGHPEPESATRDGLTPDSEEIARYPSGRMVESHRQADLCKVCGEPLEPGERLVCRGVCQVKRKTQLQKARRERRRR